MSLEIPAKSKDYTNYAQCPSCKSTDVKGPFDTEPKGPWLHLTRSWFCRTCWWTTSLKLFDDAAIAKRERAEAAAAKAVTSKQR